MQTYLDVGSILESTNATATDALEAFTNRTLLLDDIANLSTSNQGQLEALNSSIYGLQQQLQRAMQAAASVSLEQKNFLTQYLLHNLALLFPPYVQYCRIVQRYTKSKVLLSALL